MDDGVGEGEVGEGVLVHGRIEVHAVVGEVHAQTVMEVEHGGYAIEAEAVEAELVKPVAAVGEQEVEDVGLAVVEATGVPGVVPTPRTAVEVLEVGAVETRETVALILDGVGVDDVHDDRDAHAVGGVNQSLELLGRAEAGTGGEEAGDVVPEAPVVGVLHDAHELDRVVARLFNARKDVLAELRVGATPSLSCAMPMCAS